MSFYRAEVNYYHCFFTIPNPDRPGYKKNMRLNIVTKDLMKATKLIKAKYPEADIFSVAHQGRVDLIDYQANV